MEYLIILLKFIIGLSIINVWLFRTSKSSQWRGGEASNLKAEFEAYGLSKDTMKLVGTVYGISILMLGAIAMHFKIKDPIKKSFPAFTFLILSLLTIYL